MTHTTNLEVSKMLSHERTLPSYIQAVQLLDHLHHAKNLVASLELEIKALGRPGMLAMTDRLIGTI